jgi:hypothetical protein
MIATLGFVFLPATVIAGATWLVLLRRRSTLLPFFGGMGNVMLILGLSGFSPLAVFVSFGGYAMFAIVAVFVALVVRCVGTALSRAAWLENNQLISFPPNGQK